jgi:hypothetical protein
MLRQGFQEEASNGTCSVEPFAARFIESARLDFSLFSGGQVQQQLTSVLQDGYGDKYPTTTEGRLIAIV